jgi:hypothetical protein
MAHALAALDEAEVAHKAPRAAAHARKTNAFWKLYEHCAEACIRDRFRQFLTRIESSRLRNADLTPAAVCSARAMRPKDVPLPIFGAGAFCEFD